MKKNILIVILLLATLVSHGQLMSSKVKFTRADTLRGSLRPERNCYDVTFYHLNIRVNPAEKFISGSNTIRFDVMEDFKRIQVDLFANMNVDKIVYEEKKLNFSREYNDLFIDFPETVKKSTQKELTIYYSGKPQVAENAPWDGGFVWTKDKTKSDWIAVACQGTGASLWWPNKDHQSDEPDSMMISVAVPDTLMNISNGRLRQTEKTGDGFTRYDWFVSNPINNYDVTVNIGKYDHFSDEWTSSDGSKLSLDYYAMPYNMEKAKKQFEQVKPMIKCFENYFGKYPFYEDGYKLVETPYLGMEHQSAVAYGNKYKNGYRGYDIWGSGEGMRFDYIIIHESAHEWWGNNVTSKDIADMWIHESFTTYAEALYLECLYGKEVALKYLNSGKKLTFNLSPIIGPYHVNKEGSSEMYQKGSLILNTFRHVLNNDELFFALIKGLQETFAKKTTTTEEVVAYINRKTGKEFTYFFDQYLKHSAIPTLEVEFEGRTMKYRWVTDVQGFTMPVKVTTAREEYTWLYPTNEWQSLKVRVKKQDFKIREDEFYVKVKQG